MMVGKRALVTGASGFIGKNLVRRLVDDEYVVTCLVRPTSDTRELQRLGCRLVVGDLQNNTDDLATSVARQDFVFHLAAMTKALSCQELVDANVRGIDRLLAICTSQQESPVFVFVSSLAAVGPSHPSRPHTETDPCRPVSNYGLSKREAEMTAQRYSNQVPISIVRPPIVLGPGDHEGLALFKSIQDFGIHLHPGWRGHQYSVLHVDDLVDAMMRIADAGERIDGTDSGHGVYFATTQSEVNYRYLGRLIANAVGRAWMLPLPLFQFELWPTGAYNSLMAQIFRKPRYLDLDKIREIMAGAWTCSDQKIRRELGYRPSHSLQERLQQTADWYRQHGWLKSSGKPARNRDSQADTEISIT